MPLVIGTLLAVVVALFARLSGFDRDRAFYPTVLIVVGSYYELFAVLGGSTPALIHESAAMLVFVALAYLAFRFSLWFAVAGLIGHGLFDGVHGGLIANPGVPAWWPPFCAAYDVAAGVILALLIVWDRRKAATPLRPQ